jgi:hypothetical protein
MVEVTFIQFPRVRSLAADMVNVVVLLANLRRYWDTRDLPISEFEDILQTTTR